MIPLERAWEILDETLAARPAPGRERLDVRRAAGRVLAADALARHDVPPFDRATMDGFAVAAGDTAPVLEVVGEIHAGSRPRGLEAGSPPIRPGIAVRIMTGAPVPPDGARVIPVELTRPADGGRRIEVLPPGRDPAAPTFIHPRGQDSWAGAPVARAGERLTPARLAGLLACGIDEIEVAVRPRVAVLSTGDELVERAADLVPGRILNANGPLLASLIAARGYPVFAGPPVPDEPVATRERIEEALAWCEVLAISGGLSAGNRDLVPAALRGLGLEIRFDRVAIQPGKPATLAAGPRGLVFGLPGNPVSVFVTAHLFLLPALARLEGEGVHGIRPRWLDLPAASDQAPGPGDRVRFLPARLDREGGWMLLPFHNSGHILSLRDAEGLVRIEPGVERVPAGERHPFWPLACAAENVSAHEWPLNITKSNDKRSK